MTAFGALEPIAWDVLDEDGSLTNADTVALTITLPDASTVTPTVTNPPSATGRYRLAWQTTMAGRHTGRAVTTNPVTVYDFEFDVDEETPPAIISFADAKSALNIPLDDTSDDDELREFIYATTAAVEDYLHETVVRRQVTDQLELGPPRRKFRLWHAPVISLVSVQSWDGSLTWDVSNMRVSDSGLVKVMAGPPVHGDVDAVAITGYQVTPPNYRRGALIILAHLWETQRGVGTKMAGVISPEERYRQPGEWFSIPNKAKEVLGPPRPVVA